MYKLKTEYFIKEKRKNLNKGTPEIKVGQIIGSMMITDDKMYGLKSTNHNYVQCKCTDCGYETYKQYSQMLKSKDVRCKACCISHQWGNKKEVGLIGSKFIANIKGNAKTRNLEFSLTMEYLWDLWLKQEGKCALSGLELTLELLHYNKHLKYKVRERITSEKVSASVDRIDSSKGYVEGNVQWVHKAINIMKGSLSDSDFINICKGVAANNADYEDNFEPSQLNGYLKRHINKHFQKVN